MSMDGREHYNIWDVCWDSIRFKIDKSIKFIVSITRNPVLFHVISNTLFCFTFSQHIFDKIRMRLNHISFTVKYLTTLYSIDVHNVQHSVQKPLNIQFLSHLSIHLRFSRKNEQNEGWRAITKV